MKSRDRSRSRERDRRHRSRSPTVSKSKYPRHNEREKPRNHNTIKKERQDDDQNRQKSFGADRIKTEPKDEYEQKTGFGKGNVTDSTEPDKPSFELSGKLMEDTNTFNGVVIK